MHLLICTTGMNFDTIKVLDRCQTPGKGITQRAATFDTSSANILIQPS